MKKGSCRIIVPKTYDFLQIENEKDFDGIEQFCASEVKHNIYLNERFEKPEYKDKAYGYNCEWCDDGHCTSKTACKHKQKIGYIKTDFNSRYALVGDVVVFENGKIKDVLPENDFKNKYCEI